MSEEEDEEEEEEEEFNNRSTKRSEYIVTIVSVYADIVAVEATTFLVPSVHSMMT